jgi:superfamily II DNA helicase RecQ
MAATLIFFICLATSAWAQPDVEQEKIAYLVASIANLKDATFIRNGESYDAERAGEHLRLKLRYVGNRVKTAEDFITYCATRSSMSGAKYEIRFHDGSTIDSATFLRAKLAQYEVEKAKNGTR